MKRLATVLIFLLVAIPATAQRRRAVAKPSIDPSTTAGWLLTNAHPLVSTELLPYSFDLTPLRTMIGNATTVALGDGTHGTHEFMTVKLRIIDYLVRELRFQTVAFEAPFPRYVQLNAYVLGGPGDPRQILQASSRELYYYFWNTEEIVQVVEWMRAYNASRGDKPPVEIAGFDFYDEIRAGQDVVAYVAPLDPVLAADANTAYRCIDPAPISEPCRTSITTIRDRLEASRESFVSRTSTRAFDNALQSATLVVDRFRTDVGDMMSTRDFLMAKNARWLKEHYTTNDRVILWAHQEHIGKTKVQIDRKWKSMGQHLAEALGEDYFTIGTCTWDGKFTQWEYDSNVVVHEIASRFRMAAPDAYETLFRSAGVPRMLIPLRGSLPAWLQGPREYRTGGTGNGEGRPPDYLNKESLPEKLDAIIFIEETTPLRTLPL